MHAEPVVAEEDGLGDGLALGAEGSKEAKAESSPQGKPAGLSAHALRLASQFQIPERGLDKAALAAAAKVRSSDLSVC
jgi:hypothetical protein